MEIYKKPLSETGEIVCYVPVKGKRSLVIAIPNPKYQKEYTFTYLQSAVNMVEGEYAAWEFTLDEDLHETLLFTLKDIEDQFIGIMDNALSEDDRKLEVIRDKYSADEAKLLDESDVPYNDVIEDENEHNT